MSGYYEIKNWHKEVMLEELSGKLKKRDFDSLIIDTVDGINEHIMKMIPKEAIVALGGSVTLRELGIDKKLKARGNTVFDSWDANLGVEEKTEARKKQQTSSYFLTSLNAVTIDGRLVNIDGIGNRVSSMIFGPGHVIAVAGFNKIAGNIDEAIWRIKNIASPKNCKRLNLDTPCATKGYCLDCRHPKTICRITTIIDYRPSMTDFTVILTPLELGF